MIPALGRSHDDLRHAAVVLGALSTVPRGAKGKPGGVGIGRLRRMTLPIHEDNLRRLLGILADEGLVRRATFGWPKAPKHRPPNRYFLTSEGRGVVHDAKRDGIFRIARERIRELGLRGVESSLIVSYLTFEDAAASSAQIADELGVSADTVKKVRQRHPIERPAETATLTPRQRAARRLADNQTREGLVAFFDALYPGWQDKRTEVEAIRQRINELGGLAPYIARILEVEAA